MKLNSATAYSAMNPVLDQIRRESKGFNRQYVNVRSLLPGDMIAETGEVVRQMFDHIFAEDMKLVRGRVLVQFTQVSGLSLVEGTMATGDDGVPDLIEVFRPAQ